MAEACCAGEVLDERGALSLGYLLELAFRRINETMNT